MPDYTIVFNGIDDEDETITAEYYKHEEGWITFKDSAHKVVADIPERAVRMIFKTAPPTGSAIDLLRERIGRHQFALEVIFSMPEASAGKAETLATKLAQWIAADEKLIAALE